MFSLYLGGDTSAHMTLTSARAARGWAVKAATDYNAPVRVVAGGKTRYVVQPDGRVLPPEGMEAPQGAACTRDNGRPCFCPPCRAIRRDERI